jgi:predicted nicotinamide N-methyase
VIELHEPALTEDNLGLKTWGSSLLMSKQLSSFTRWLPHTKPSVLELGAGTGLVGISAACVWKTAVVLSDLPDIVPNLSRNLAINAELIKSNDGTVSSRALDWADTSCEPSCEDDKFPVIVAADPIYSPEHPQLLVRTILRWLRQDADSVVIIELPLREHYLAERDELKSLMKGGGLALEAEGEEVGHDDWMNADGTTAEIRCWWGLWRRRSDER